MAGAEGGAGIPFDRGLQRGVSDEGAFETLGLEIGRLERKQGEKTVDPARQLARPPRPPGPDRRRHIVDKRAVDPVETPPDAVGELGRIDGHDRVGRQTADGRSRLGHSAHDADRPRQHLDKPHDGEFLHREQALETLRGHRLAAHPRQSDPMARRLAQRHDQPPADLVPGRFPGDEEDRRRCVGPVARQEFLTRGGRRR